MNYELEIQRSLPSVFAALNGSTPPLAAGSGTGTYLTTTPTTVAWNAWTQLRENSPFTVELWYLPVTVTGETIVAGHLTDGIIFNGTDLILRIAYSNSTTLEARWTPSEVQSWHLALVYDGIRFVLYVNGDAVISLDALPGITWSSTQTVLSLNRVLSGTGTGVYDALTLYYRALSVNDIQAHYVMGKSVTPAPVVSASKGGSVFQLTYANVDVYDKVDFDLSDGNMTNLGYGTKLTANDATGGTWMTAIPLAAMAGAKTAGVHLTYVGIGVTLSYSLDGTTWTTTPNKRTVLEDATPPDMLFLRLQLANDKSWVSSFRADILGSRTVEPVSGARTLTFTKAAFDQTPGMQLDYQYDQGAQLYNNGYLTIAVDPNSPPTNMTSIEMWIKVPVGSGTYATIFDNFGYLSLDSGGLHWSGLAALYIDGAVRTTALPRLDDGMWHHIIAVGSTSSNNFITVGADKPLTNFTNMSVGHLAVYPQALSAADALAIYNTNIGASIYRINDSGVITVTEKVPAVDIYAYTWSIVSGGL